MSQTPEKSEPESKKFAFFNKFKKPGKQLFWVWIAYQCIKGTITTTIIWIPLLYFWWNSSH